MRYAELPEKRAIMAANKFKKRVTRDIFNQKVSSAVLGPCEICQDAVSEFFSQHIRVEFLPGEFAAVHVNYGHRECLDKAYAEWDVKKALQRITDNYRRRERERRPGRVNPAPTS